MPQRLRPSEILSKAQAPALLVTDLVNIRYLTGVAVSAGYVLIEQGRGMRLFVDDRYREKAEKECAPGIRVCPVGEWQNAMTSLARCAVESNAVTVEQLDMFKRKYKNTKFVQSKDDAFRALRRRKTEKERGAIRKACAIVRRVLRHVPSLLRPGITERDLAWKLACLAHEYGADGLAFETIVAFGKHTSRPHHETGQARLRAHDIVQVDMGVTWRGYCSDFSRVYFIGEPTTEQRRCFAVLKKAKRAAEALLMSGVTNHTLDAAARDVLRRHGMEHAFTHALGHGLGLEIHEGITLSSKAPKTRLLRHEAVTIEPGIYFPGTWGMRLEDTHIVE